MNIIEAIKERRSVRSYDGQSLSAADTAVLQQAIAESFSPFGGNITIRLKSFGVMDTFKPSTYGMISKATDFFLVALRHDEESAMTTGFQFEQIVLKAWEMGLGTCWIAATFKGSDFDKGEDWPEGQQLTIVCPVGRPAGPTMKEKLTRLTLGSKNRKAFDTLFFDGSFNTPLSRDNTFGEALEMMRLAPSSTNSQPWRALVDGTSVHFYCKPKSPASPIDCGIGIYHFYAAEQYHGHNGDFFKSSSPTPAPDDWKYLTSYRRG